MIEDSKDPKGTAWTQDEIDLIVADYFSMRSKFLRGEPFFKAHHYQKLIKEIRRSKGSIEHKYMNISATLERLSLPWPQGYALLCATFKPPSSPRSRNMSATNGTKSFF